MNYRRFFDINTLVALRMEDPAVFAESTALIAELVERGDVDGLRIDHIDGLRRPIQYAQRLRDATTPDHVAARREDPPARRAAAALGARRHQRLRLPRRRQRPVRRPGRARRRSSLCTRRSPARPSDFAAFALEGKREILRTTLVSDVERLTGLLANVCDAYPAQRDHTHSEMRDAIVELVAAVPVYRTYVDPRTPPPSTVDAAIIRDGRASRARATRPRSTAGCSTSSPTSSCSARPRTSPPPRRTCTSRESDLVLRLQQLCAATMAKGVEDTACYRHLVLVSLNEVGDSPGPLRAGCRRVPRAQRAQPGRAARSTLLATSTHDTKRSEDVRCRIDLLSEVPAEWSGRGAPLARHERRRTGAAALPDAVDGVPALPDARRRLAADRRARHGVHGEGGPRGQAARPAGCSPTRRTTPRWPRSSTRVLADPRFVADLEGFVGTLVDWGRVNSLSTTLLKLTSPGRPGHLPGVRAVGPQPRRPRQPPPGRLRAAPQRCSSARRGPAAGRAPGPDDRDSGAAKLLLIREALALRARRPEAFDAARCLRAGARRG